jgi:hypothetical protein
MQPVSKSVRAANLATVSHPIPGKSRACRVITAACGVLIAMAPGLCAEGAAQTKAATATTLAVTSGGRAVSTVTSGSVVTLTATVKAGAAALTTGQVNFCDATASHCTDIHLLGAAQLTGAGAATLKFRPGIGSHSYKAVFLGTTSNAGSASPASELTATGTIPSLATTTTINQTGSWGAYKLSAAVTENREYRPTQRHYFIPGYEPRKRGPGHRNAWQRGAWGGVVNRQHQRPERRRRHLFSV